MSEFIQTTVQNGVQTIRIARPEKKNALNIAMYEAMYQALEESDRSPDMRVRLILGLPGIFTAGNDIADFIEAGQRGPAGLAPVMKFLRALIFSEKPIVAAADGLAVGIGATLLLHCDMAYASPEAVFMAPFTDLGLVPEAGSSLVAPQRMGQARAFAFLVAGEPLTANAAREAGLINAVVPREGLEAHAATTATKLAAKPREALALSRRLVRGDPAILWARVEEEGRLFAERLVSDEAKQAFQAFMQKRK
jgi:enoyl-CoA hydratase/carnithine racemase